MITIIDTAMLIDFENPVLPVGEHSQRAFIEILNLILVSGDITELSRLLCRRDRNEPYGILSGYFKWSYTNYSFTLWQRMEYGSQECFRNKVLEVKHISLICQDRVKPDSIRN